MKLSSENILDLKLWLYFLHHPTAYSRLFADFTISQCAEWIRFFTDASKNLKLGCGGWNETEWFMRQWHAEFIIWENPSIAFLELFGVAAGVLLWIKKYQNSRVVINCDNQSVVNMINNSSSTCKNCLVLIRVITFECLIHNVKLYARFVPTDKNEIADALSRLKYSKFRKLTVDMNMSRVLCEVPESIWPIEKFWIK